MNRRALLSLAAVGLAGILLAACQQAPAPVPQAITITVKEDGTIVMDGEVVTREELQVRLNAIAARDPQPEIHIASEGMAKYGVIAHVMAAVQRAGLARMGVIGGT